MDVPFDNSSEVTTSFNSTAALQTTSKSPVSQTVPIEILAPVSLSVFCVGICANAVVLAVLVRARRQAASSAHILIANQSAMDLFACVFATCTIVLMITHGYKYRDNDVLDGAICVLFEDDASKATR